MLQMILQGTRSYVSVLADLENGPGRGLWIWRFASLSSVGAPIGSAWYWLLWAFPLFHLLVIYHIVASLCNGF